MKKMVGGGGYAPVSRPDVDAAYSDLEQLGLVEVPALEDLRLDALQLCLDLSLGSYDAYSLRLRTPWTWWSGPSNRASFFNRVSSHPIHGPRVRLLCGITCVPPL